jgi:hypothetical protein
MEILLTYGILTNSYFTLQTRSQTKEKKERNQTPGPEVKVRSH